MYSRRQAIAVAGIGIAALSGCADIAEFATGDGPLSETAQPAAIAEQTLSETGYSLAERDTLEIEEDVQVGGETRRVEITNQIATYERAVDPTDALSDETVSSDTTDTDDVDQEDVPDDVDEEDLPDDVDEEDLPDDVDPDSLGSAIPSGTADDPTEGADRSPTPRQLGGSGTDSASSRFILFTTPAFELLGQPLNPIAQMDNAALATELAGQVEPLSVGSEQSTTSTTILGSDTTLSTFDGTLNSGGAEIDVEIVLASVSNEGDYVIGFGAYPQVLAETESANVSTLFDGIEHPVSDQ